MTQYDYDVVVWDTVGGAYTSESMNKASGGSEKEVVQLAEGLAKKGFRVLCLNGIERRAHAEMGVVDKRDGKNVDTRGSVTWDNANSAKNIRCKTLVVQRYSRLPLQMEVLADRMVVRATDVYGDYYKNSALTHLCVSEWQAAAFRAAAIPCVVIPAMLDDDYYELAATTKIRGRFIYASAYMKGLKETLAKWKELRHRFSSEMRSCTLFITSPGYGKLKESPCDFLPGDENVVILHDLPPRELAKYMATCEGLFYVNVFPETFCAVAAIANAVGCRVHVLEKHGRLSGVQEAANGFISQRDDVFDDCFLLGLREKLKAAEPNDFRVSTVMSQWLDALRLAESWANVVPPVRYPESATQARLDMSDEEKSKLFGDAARRLIENVKWPSGKLKGVAERARAGLTDKERAILDKHMQNAESSADPDGGPAAPGRLLGEAKIGPQEIMKIPTICLVMLAKNAESTIKRALESVVGFVDYAVFQFDDEASSEKMRAIIHDAVEFPGFFTYVPWVNFSVNRNKLLDEARNFFNSTYVLTLDADDHFVGLNPDFKSRLTHDVYGCDVHDNNGAWRYTRRVLWRADKGFRYEGPAHETLVDTQPVTTGKLEGVHVERGYIPRSSAETRAKYLHDYRLFSAELHIHPDDTRSAYYLAQSLEDASCGGTEIELQRDALEAYETRAKMGGFLQEKFVSAMKVGKIRKGLKESELSIVEAFTQAVNILPERAVEAVYEIMLYYNNEGGSKEKAVAAHEAFSRHTNSAKTPEGFLVDVTIYEWGYRFQLAIALCYVNRKSEAKVIFEDLLTTGPAHLHDVLRSNLTYCVPPVLVDTAMLDRMDAKYGRLEERRAVPVGPVVVPDATPRVVTRDSKPVPWFTPRET